MNFKFEKLIIWQSAMEYGEQINTLAKGFPKEESFYLNSQIRRAADAIALNIAMGSIVHSHPDLIKYTGYSIRSLAEVITCLFKARNRNYINDSMFAESYQSAYKLMSMLIAFRKKLIDMSKDKKTISQEVDSEIVEAESVNA